MNFKWKRSKGISFSFYILYVLKFWLCQRDMPSSHEVSPCVFRKGKAKGVFSVECFQWVRSKLETGGADTATDFGTTEERLEKLDSDHVSVHALITWQIMQWSRGWSCTDHVVLMHWSHVNHVRSDVIAVGVGVVQACDRNIGSIPLAQSHLTLVLHWVDFCIMPKGSGKKHPKK